jgi:hypothetical protein
MRIIASLTTIPSRIDLIRPVLESALAQTTPVEHVELNVPYVCVRTKQTYELPGWLESMERVRVFRTEDYGPITKVAPTFLRYRNDRETYIWSIDDDCAYPPNQLALLCVAHNPEKRRILTRHGGQIQPDGTVQFWTGEAEVSMFEAFGGILYPPDCIDGDFSEYLRITSSNEVCKKNDDMVLSLYFLRRKMPIYLYNKPSEETPYMHKGWLGHSKTDALSAGGHVENYKYIFAFVNSLPQILSKEPV